jgi:hypothetical protein
MDEGEPVVDVAQAVVYGYSGHVILRGGSRAGRCGLGDLAGSGGPSG